MIDGGAVFTNASYKHANTTTGPGHAVILSGTYGRTNGIVSNSWYDRTQKRSIYCVEDRSVQLLGSTAEGRSPANFTTVTFGDMLRISTAFHAKVITISNKDRAAILPGGKYANMAFWMMDSSFVSSTYYAQALPAWARKFNASGKINSYFGRIWERSLPPSAFDAVDDDDVPYEDGSNGLGRTFPHPIRGDSATARTPSYYSALLTSPFGAEVLASFAKEAVIGEGLGKHPDTDLLSVSFSSTDYVGHAFGPYSHEMLEMNVSMDRILADFFRFLDREVGLSRCLIVMTADHGVSPVAEYLHERSGRPAVQRLLWKPLAARAESLLTTRFPAAKGRKWIERFSGGTLYLDAETLTAAGVTTETASRAFCDDLLQCPEVAAAFTRQDIRSGGAGSRLERRVWNSFHERRSGDAFVVFNPLWQSGLGGDGASHGEPVESDAHVMLMMRGSGIRPGLYDEDASPADIAPTLSALTGVEFTPFCAGRILREALDRSDRQKPATR